MMLTQTKEPSHIALWIGAAIIALGMHAGVGLLAAALQHDRNAVMGGQEAIMLEFAEEPMAPDVEDVSEDIQEETVKQEKVEEKVEDQPKEVAQDEPEKVEPQPEPQPEPQKSEMVEEVKKPLPPKEVKKVKKVEPKKADPKKDVKKADQTQKAKGPQIAAKNGPTFAAPTTNRQFGSDGHLVASWQNKVQRRIAFVAARTKRPGAPSKSSSYVTFSFDKQGNITSARTSRSSGDPSIDALALQIVRKSSPIPTPPDGWNGSLTVPVEVR